MANKFENIQEPNALMRPAPFWSWNDKLDEAELRRQIREMASKGWGSFFMHSRVGLVTGYLSDEWMQLVNACIEEAERAGVHAWLYDEDKWPSGIAGGLIPNMDESFRSRALVLHKKGTAAENDTPLSSINYCGVDYDICKRVSSLGESWFSNSCFVDLMNPNAVSAFLKATHEKYKESCGEHFGKTIPGIFTDEPCYIFRYTYDVPVVPWSEFIPGLFNEMKGYDIKDKLPLLFFDIDDYRKVRFDFYDVASELLKRSFTKQYYDWCTENNLIMTGHFMSEDSLCFQTLWSGDVMSNYEFMHWPGIDKLGRYVNFISQDPVFADQIVTVKQVSSAADQLGKERTFGEVFGCVGGQVSLFHRKWMGDWLAALGINFINHHLSLYSMRGERKRDYPANFFYQQPWWDDEKGLADYMGRMCAAGTEGKRSVDILLIQPLSSVWCECSPLHQDNKFSSELSYDIPFAGISRRLMEDNLDFHFGNEKLIAKYGSIKDGLFSVGQHSYNCVIVPPSLNLKSSTLALLTEFLSNGGKVITIPPRPSLVDGSEQNIELNGAIGATSVEDAAKIAGEFYPNRIRTINVLTGKNSSDILVHTRIVGDITRHFICNTNENREIRLRMEVPGCAGENFAIMDLHDGGLYRLDAADGKFYVNLAPAGSLLLICGEESGLAKDTVPMVLGSGSDFVNHSLTVPATFVDRFECEPLEENVLLLNDFVLDIDGKQVYSGPVCGAWNQHFYSLPDGTAFRAEYTFQSECEMEDCFAAIELAENLDRITFNGSQVKALKTPGEMGEFLPERSWKDVNFTKVPLPVISRGMNKLVIEGKKINNVIGPGFHVRVPDWQNHNATEAEEAYICGKFSLKPVSDGLFRIAPYNKPDGRNITKEGFPFYAGRMALSTYFDIDYTAGSKVLIRLNGAQMASARVRVNNKECGVLRWKPYLLDITEAVVPGKNNLEIEMAPTLVNLMGPNRHATIKSENGIGPYWFIDMESFTRNYQLFDFGLESASIYLL